MMKRLLILGLFLLVWGQSERCEAAGVVLCRQAKGPIKIDGLLDEWTEAKPAIQIPGQEPGPRPGDWRGKPDASAGIFLAFDDKNFYLAARVTDDKFLGLNKKSQEYLNDGLELYFDVDRNGDAGTNSYSDDDVQICLSDTPDGPSMTAWRRGAPDPKEFGSIAMKRASDCPEAERSLLGEDGYIVEIEIPFDFLGFTPEKVRLIGFDVGLDDDDNPETKGQDCFLSWTGNGNQYSDPTKLGKMIFVKQDDEVLPALAIDNSLVGERDGLALTVYVVPSKPGTTHKVVIRSSAGDRTETLITGEIQANYEVTPWKPEGRKLIPIEMESTLTALLDGKEFASVPITYLGTAFLEKRCKAVELTRAQMMLSFSRLAKKGIDIKKEEASLEVIRYSMDLIRSDIRSRNLARAKEHLEYLEEMEKRLNARVVALESMENPPKAWTFPSALDVQVKKSAFRRGSKIVPLCGVMGWSEPIEDIPILSRYGFNCSGIEMGPMGVLVGHHIYADASVDRVKKALERAEEHGTSLMLLLSPHYFPQWARKAYPEVNGCGNGFISYCLESPNARAVVEDFLRYLIPAIKDSPALNSYCLANEYTYQGYCDYTQKRFRERMKTQYGTIGALNDAWASQYRDFDEITVTDQIAKDPDAAEAFRYDWFTFHYERSAEFLSWMKSVIRTIDKKTPVHVKTLPWAFGAGEYVHGVDREAINEFSEINGCDSWTWKTDAKGYSMAWVEPTMNYDLLRSLGPEKPTFNTEDHLLGDNSGQYVPYSHIYAGLWQQALHGGPNYTLWVWARNEADPTLAKNLWTRPMCTEAAAHASLDFIKNADLVTALGRVRPQVRILYSFPSIILDDPVHVADSSRVYESLYFQDIPVGFATEKQIQKKALRGKQTKLLIVPSAKHVQEDTCRAILDYAKRGGTVVLTGDALARDEHGRTRDLSALKQLLATGRVTQLPTQKDPRVYRDQFASLLDRSGVERIYRGRVKEDPTSRGIVLRPVKHRGKDYVFMMNVLHEPRTVSVLNADRDLVGLRSILTEFEGNEVRLPPSGVEFLEVE